MQRRRGSRAIVARAEATPEGLLALALGREEAARMPPDAADRASGAVAGRLRWCCWPWWPWPPTASSLPGNLRDLAVAHAPTLVAARRA